MSIYVNIDYLCDWVVNGHKYRKVNEFQMLIKSFNEYIKESHSQIFENKQIGEDIIDGCNIIFVTKNPKKVSFTEGEVHKFRESCKKYDVNFFPCDVDDIKYAIDNGSGNLIIENMGRFSKENTLVMIRHPHTRNQSEDDREITKGNLKQFFNILKSNGFLIANDIDVKNKCLNKFTTFETLKSNGVDTIETVLLTKDDFIKNGLDDSKKLEDFLSKNNLQLPIVVKVLDGTQGIGVFKCMDITTLLSIVQYLVRKEKTNSCILQPFCDIDGDVRLHVFCKSLDPKTANIDDFEIVGAMKRGCVEGDFRSNYSLGGKISQYSPTPEETELAKKSAKALGAVWCGVDVCYDKLSKKNYVIEVNATPALKGITQVSKDAPSDVIVKLISDRLSTQPHK